MAEIKAFGKPKPKSDAWPASLGSVVIINSDFEGQWPKTVGDYKDGKLYCRWDDANGQPQADWFSPDEVKILLEEEEENAIEFKAEFETVVQ